MTTRNLVAGLCSGVWGIQIHLAGDEEILAKACVEVTTHQTLQNERPVPGGLYDPRLGAIATHLNCNTCGNKYKNCFGHNGVYKLNTSLHQPLAYDDIIKWLKVVCLKCGNLMIDPAKLIGYVRHHIQSLK
jgi:DNA-directed RNA polymerase beta' subunit